MSNIKNIKDAYNIKIVHYPNHDEVHLYSVGIQSKERVFTEDLTFNPFTNSYEKLKNYDNYNPYKVLRDSFHRTKDNIIKLARNFDRWEWFATLTFNPDSVDRYDYDKCVKKLSKWLNNIRNNYAPDIVYLVVPEQHKDGAWHFHGLFSDCGNLDFLYSGVNDKNGNKIYNLKQYRNGFSTFTKIYDVDRVCSYILKYITKDLCSVTNGRKRYWYSRSTLKMPAVDKLIWDADYESKLNVLSSHIQHIYQTSSDFNKFTYLTLDCKFTDIDFNDSSGNVYHYKSGV